VPQLASVQTDAPRSKTSKENTLLNETLTPEAKGNVLLQPLSKCTPEPLHWLGTSYGLTEDLFSFWNRNRYLPVYLRQTPNELTGEFTSIMLKTLHSDESRDVAVGNLGWLNDFHHDFQKRFRYLLGYHFRSFAPSLALSVLAPNVDTANVERALQLQELEMSLSAYDIKRLEMYSKNLLDHHIVTDTLPVLAHWYFANRLPVALSLTQAAILAGCGLQSHSVDEVANRLNLAPKHLLGLFNKMIRKITNHLITVKEEGLASTLPASNAASRSIMSAIPETLGKSLSSAEKEVLSALDAQQKKLLEQTGLDSYAITSDDSEWKKVLPKHGAVPSTISVKTDATQLHMDEQRPKQGQAKRRKSSESGSGKKKFKNL